MNSSLLIPLTHQRGEDLFRNATAKFAPLATIFSLANLIIMSRADSDSNSPAHQPSPGDSVDEPGHDPRARSGDSTHLPSDAGTASPVDPSLLDQVLQNTLSLSSVAPHELSDLIDIGRRYCGQPLVVDPIGLELVEVILRHRLSAATSSPAERREMARQISESLLEDPHCETRLRDFWNQLVEAAR
jgi:hypothetical protein